MDAHRDRVRNSGESEMTRKELDILRDKRFALTRGHEPGFAECFSGDDRLSLVAEIEKGWEKIKEANKEKVALKTANDDAYNKHRALVEAKNHAGIRANNLTDEKEKLQKQVEELESTIARQSHEKGPFGMEDQIAELKKEAALVAKDLARIVQTSEAAMKRLKEDMKDLKADVYDANKSRDAWKKKSTYSMEETDRYAEEIADLKAKLSALEKPEPPADWAPLS